MNVIDFLVNRSRRVAELRSCLRRADSAVAELYGQVMDERRAKWKAREEAALLREAAAVPCKKCEHRQRELAMERQSTAELRDRIRLTDANVRCCHAAMQEQLAAAHSEVGRLWGEINAANDALAAERQRRIEVEAAQEHLKGKGVPV